MCKCRNDTRQFYQNVKHLTEGLLRLWIKHFFTLFEGDDDTSIAFRNDVLNPINDDGLEIPLPGHEEAKAGT